MKKLFGIISALMLAGSLLAGFEEEAAKDEVSTKMKYLFQNETDIEQDEDKPGMKVLVFLRQELED